MGEPSRIEVDVEDSAGELSRLLRVLEAPLSEALAKRILLRPQTEVAA